MKSANRIGCAGLASVVIAFAPALLPDTNGYGATLAIALQLMGFTLCIYASIRGSRWWLIEPAVHLAFIAWFVWLLSFGH